MNPTTRLVLLGTLSLIFLATTGSGYLYLIERNQLTLQNQRLSTDLHSATEENKGFKKDIKKLTNDLYKAETDHGNLQKDYATLVQKSDVLHVQIETLTRRNEALTERLEYMEVQLESVSGERDALIQRVDEMELAQQARLPRVSVERRAPERRGDRADREADEAVLTERGSLREEPVSPPEPARTPLGAKIIDVNEKHSFFVINSGSMDGIEQGMFFTILDNKQREIGSAEVVEVRDRVSALSILEVSRRKKIKEEYWVIEQI